MNRTLRRQVMSMRGEPVDFGAMAAKNESQRTLGNTRTNVRGDILGDNATVLKTQEQIEAEWARKKALQQSVSKPADIKAGGTVNPQKTLIADDMDFPSVSDLVNQGTIPTPSKRKIVDSD